jgi:hypothetical protein
MATEEEVAGLLDRVEKVTKEKKLDLSSDEDLSIALMNLINIEEHLFFTAEKTNKDIYLDLLNEVRSMRKDLMKEMITEYEGEVWCVIKHLMATSMRLMEVGTKQLNKGNKEKAKDLFHKSYQLYSLFWAINLNIVSTKEAKEKGLVSEKDIKKEDVPCSCGVDEPDTAAAFNKDVKKDESPPERRTSSNIEPSEVKKKDNPRKIDNPNPGKNDFFSKISDIITKVVNCCKE